MDTSIAFIGAGRMAEALISGLISSDTLKSENITVSDIDNQRLSYLKATYGINTTTSNTEAAGASETVLLAVKPQQSKEVTEEIAAVIKGKLVISIMAGIKTQTIEKATGTRAVRAMPNTPALVAKGITAIAAGPKANQQDVETASLVLQNAGQVIIVNEDSMDAVTAVSGSGPAYFFWLTEVLAEAGIKEGLSRDEASNLAKATFIGAAGLLEKSGGEPEDLRKNVTSPGGTTQAAIESLEKDKAAEIIAKAVEAAKQRSEELSKD